MQIVANPMIIKNVTKNRGISSSARLCNTVFSKAIGLMLSKNRRETLIFIFDEEKIISLHMLFVFYPIDVLFLSKNKVVVDKKENFRPFTIYKSRKKAMYAIEMPKGIIKKTKSELGDRIKF